MPELYTVGYEGASQEDLLHTLLHHDIETLVDIRELPQSRKPGLSKKALALAAEERAIAYVHIRELGTPRDVRYRHKADHDAAAFREGYLAHLATQDAAMEALVARAGRERCCLLCYEADVRECHRWFVAERAVVLSAGSLTPVHLSLSGAEETVDAHGSAAP